MHCTERETRNAIHELAHSRSCARVIRLLWTDSSRFFRLHLYIQSKWKNKLRSRISWVSHKAWNDSSTWLVYIFSIHKRKRKQPQQKQQFKHAKKNTNTTLTYHPKYYLQYQNMRNMVCYVNVILQMRKVKYMKQYS